jgi:hypothetical protein
VAPPADAANVRSNPIVMRAVHHVRRSGKIPAICGGGALALLEKSAPSREILFLVRVA